MRGLLMRVTIQIGATTYYGTVNQDGDQWRGRICAVPYLLPYSGGTQAQLGAAFAALALRFHCWRNGIEPEPLPLPGDIVMPPDPDYPEPIPDEDGP